jgi:predicted PurR-regulated permease PerM
VRISWRTAVNLVYIILVILLGGIITLAGFAIVSQIQSLFGFVQTYINDLPEIVTSLTSQAYQVGPFRLDFSKYDLTNLTNQLLSYVEPVLGRAGGLISTIATSAAGSLGWALFILVISYFILADAGRVSNDLVHVDIPGYDSDVRRLGHELRRIWNTFLRGQIIIIVLVILVYAIVMAFFGMRFSLGIAILAGFARFVPYLGPAILWVVIILVSLFQGSNWFGLLPYQYAILVVVTAILVDQVFDNLVSPRILGETLGVHPAAVLIAAIVAARLLGLIGLVLAAPVLATVLLLGRYILRKMFDLDPWPDVEAPPQPVETALVRARRRLRTIFRFIQRRIKET